METPNQQTKDFMASFFPPDMDPTQLQAAASDHAQFQFHHQQPPSNGSQVDLAMGSLMGVNDQSYNPAALLEQQYKLSQLQQLQQLQNQIFQQQIALISGSSPSLEPEPRERVVPFHGLPTPGNSTELRATPSVEYVSPMILDYNDTFSQPYAPPRGSTSAPAHIAFRTTPNELDFDISPLTSPWLGAHQQPSAASRAGTKRNAASSSDEDVGTSSGRPSRKKQSPAIRASVPIPPKRSSNSRSKSANSTPLLRSTRARKGSINVPGDTPSPVDLSMPPPAPPIESSPFPAHSSPALGPQLTPVTPASIMNLGRLGINTTIKSSSKKSASPNVKALTPTVASSSRQQHLPPKKTSHKAAEQKRRDSLKTTFDDLRTLLPPIPLPNETNADEPVLPGALPPRGPPKAGGEGPNKGVSKLQLLMCGNDYIRQLHGRVQRRDDEIGRLRREVTRLRSVLRGEIDLLPEEEGLDLERDLDDVELGHFLGRNGQGMLDDDEEDD
ncbi:BHLH domain-containing protein [Mycena indigotica]|uniref:BHLH domain-containing protein n=1 Tax=Mycena indigotica TaxID=2126181 RepID=A0A8H6WKY5_9AGAR|nr:BHLH domain-containing protein [Mycena indigotica]KAF7316239.1 BHLH domain-containing protein [Mycena indigotica]